MLPVRCWPPLLALAVITAAFVVVDGQRMSEDPNFYCENEDTLCKLGEHDKRPTPKHIVCERKEFEFSVKCPQQYTRTIFLDESLRDLIQDIHNLMRNALASGQLPNLRASVNQDAMMWDEELAFVAAYQMIGCEVERDKCRNTEHYPNAGQNVGIKQLPGRSMEDMRYAIEQIIFNWFQCFQGIDEADMLEYPADATDHIATFAQLMQHDNNRFGCALGQWHLNVDTHMFLVCNYGVAPRHGQPVYQLLADQKPGSEFECMSGRSTRWFALCSTRIHAPSSSRRRSSMVDGRCGGLAAVVWLASMWRHRGR